MLKQPLNFSLKLASATALLFALFPSSAKAAILFGHSSGVTEASNFWYNPLESSTSIMGFDEEQNVIIPDDPYGRKVYHQHLNEWQNIDVRTLPYLKAGLEVDSHMIYFTKPESSQGRIEATATIKFDGKIVGLIGDAKLFFYKHGHFKYMEKPSFVGLGNDLFAPNIIYNPNGKGYNWSLEEQHPIQEHLTLDKVEFVDEYTITVDWGTYGAIDPLRVLTLSPSASTHSVPEPLTLLGAGTAIAMGGFFKSKVKNKTKDT